MSYLDTLNLFRVAEKHFFVCPEEGTQHIPDNPPHSWSIVGISPHLDSGGGLTSFLRCIEALDWYIKESNKCGVECSAYRLSCLLGSSKEQFTSNKTDATAHVQTCSFYGNAPLLPVVSYSGRGPMPPRIMIGLQISRENNHQTYPTQDVQYNEWIGQNNIM